MTAIIVQTCAVAGPGGLLSASRVLLTNPGRNGHLQQALLSPDGASATEARRAVLPRST